MDVDLAAWEEGSEDSEAGLEEGLAGLWGKEEHRGAHSFDDMDLSDICFVISFELFRVIINST
jgi:hypothetical protein